MPYQFRQTGAEIQDILDQVGENTTDIAQNTQDIARINGVNVSGNVATVSVASGNTWQEITNMSVIPGKYLVIGSASYGYNAAGGDRALGISTINSVSGQFSREIVSVPATTGGYNTTVQTIRYLDITSNSTLYLMGRITGGVSLNAFAYMVVIRLKE